MRTFFEPTKIGPDYEAVRLIDGCYSSIFIVDTPASGKGRRNVRAAAETYSFFLMSNEATVSFSEKHGLAADRGMIPAYPRRAQTRREFVRSAKKVLGASLVGITENYCVFFYPDDETLVEMRMRYG